MIVLDTNILVEILRKNDRGKQWLDFLKTKSITFTSISSYELFLGAKLSSKQNENMQAVQKLVQKYAILPFSVKSSYIAGELQAKLQNQGNKIDLRDLYIAAIALEHHLPVATDNIKHFNHVENLEIITI